MSERRRGLELKVGFTVVLSLLVLFVGLLWLKQYALLRQRHLIEVTFPEVGGLSPGDPVMVNGVKEGVVKRVKLSPKGEALVTMEIKSEVKLSQGAGFSVENIGLMGEKFVSIFPGTTSIPLAKRGPLRGNYQPGFSELISKLAGVLQGMSLTMNAFENEKMVSQTLEAIHNLSVELDSLVRENRGRISGTIEDLREGSQGLRRVMMKGGGVDTTLARLSRTTEKLDALIAKLEDASVSWGRISSKVERGEGSLGQLVNDKELYLELRKTVKNLNDLVADIKKNPKRYFRFRLF